jgi:hypothetical protein
MAREFMEFYGGKHMGRLLVDDSGRVDEIPEYVAWEEASRFIACRLAVHQYFFEEETRQRRVQEQNRIDRLISVMRQRTQDISPIKEVHVPHYNRRFSTCVSRPRVVGMGRYHRKR